MFESVFCLGSHLCQQQLEQKKQQEGSYIHNVVKNNESSSLGLLLIANADLAYTSVATKEVI